jgi:predicted nucleotidyltransferase
MKLTKEKILDYLGTMKVELEEFGIEKVALFGSFAKNQPNIYSDIDIAIQKKANFLDNHSAYDYFTLLNHIKFKVRKHFHVNVDIFDLDSKSIFKKEIEKELIYV